MAGTRGSKKLAGGRHHKTEVRDEVKPSDERTGKTEALKVLPNDSSAHRDGSVFDDFLPGSGDLARRVKEFDWSQTPIGPAGNWPQSLKTAVSLCLASRFQLIIFWTRDLVQIYNDAFVTILGNKHPLALGQTARECWAEMWEDIEPLYNHVFETGTATWTEHIRLPVNRHGYLEESLYTMSYTPIFREDGSVGGVFNVVIETTEQVVTERRTATLRDLAARTAEAQSVEEACRISADVLSKSEDIPFATIYLMDPDEATLRLASTARVELGGPVAPRELEWRETQDWPLGEAIRTGKARVVDDILHRYGPIAGGPWGHPVEKAVVLPLVRPGRTVPYGVMVAAATPQRALDADFLTFFNMVAGQVSTVIGNTRSMEEERARAEALAELDRAKTAFFSNVSHEFRTPLTLMIGPLEDLLLKQEGEINKVDHEQLSLIHRNGLRLQKLVNTLLDFSRIEAGRIQASYEPTDLSAFTAELASVFRSAIEKAGMKLKIDCPTLPENVYVDRDMYEKVLLNLLSNAFKFTFEGEIKVSLRWCGDHVELDVKDTGTGIAPDELPKVFERFHRIRGAKARTHEGTGIGLALVQELVKLHGGNVKVASVLGQGTTFTVSIPTGLAHLPRDRISAPKTLASTSMGATPYIEEALRWLPEGGKTQDYTTAGEDSLVPLEVTGSGERAKVLLADDNADMRGYVQRLLSNFYDVEAVADGSAALVAARKNLPDLVVTDIMMPGLDGFGLLNALRADVKTRAIPVIFLSARAGEESRIEGLEAGADDYLVKPFSARELIAKVGAHLEMARIRREAMQREQELRGEAEKRASELDEMLAERKRAESERSISMEFLQLINEARRIEDLIHRVTDFLQEKSGCEAVGIRIREGDDYPYYETRGFSKEFVRAENRLCLRDNEGLPVLEGDGYPILECMCGNVIRKRFDPSKPFFTERGSFWTNNTTRLLATTTEEDRQARTRNRCNGEGYESVTVIAIRLGDDCLGLLQMNDRRIGLFTPELIAMWERLADYLAVTLAKFETDQALRASEGRLRRFYESGLVGVIYWNMDGKITDANDKFLEMTGYTRDDLYAGRIDWANMTPPEYRYLDEQSLAEQKATGVNKTPFEKEYIRKDGSRIPIIIAGAMLDEARFNGVAFVLDITERKKTEEEKEMILAQLRDKTNELQNLNEELEVKSEELAGQTEELAATNEELSTNNEELQSVTASLRETSDYLQSLINNANAPIIVWDPKFTITRFNHAFERLSGYTANEVVGRHLSILFPRESGEESLNKINRTLAGEHWETVEIPIQHKYGSIRIALWNSANVYNADKKLTATIAQGLDITDRKRMERELSEAKTQAELYLDLMGHDISNMHQIILMQLELAEDVMKLEGKLEGEDREMIHTSARTLERAAKLIDNVRMLQKLQSGEYDMEVVDLANVLEDALKDYSCIPGRNITIKFAPNGTRLVKANLLLKDVFGNLVDNAVKHSRDPLEIGVEVNKVGLNGSSYYRVTIEDNGNGIPDDKKEEVFHRFRRGQTKARGTGLGLYLVKSLVEGFGGYVEIHNRVPGDYTKGTRFLVYLPVAEVENAG